MGNPVAELSAMILFVILQQGLRYMFLCSKSPVPRQRQKLGFLIKMIKISTRPALAGSLLLRPAQAIETKRPNILAFRDALQFEAERGYMSTFSKGKIGALMKVAGGICPSLSFFRKSFIWTLTWNCDLLSLFIRLLMDFASSVGRNLIMAHSLPSLNLVGNIL
ncbi:hypothetical protein FRC15_005149 [Serendipita sp. 397]|nr:hypothetical protein FRC15_005149 [Serendipita sp. 397]